MVDISLVIFTDQLSISFLFSNFENPFASWTEDALDLGLEGVFVYFVEKFIEIDILHIIHVDFKR